MNENAEEYSIKEITVWTDNGKPITFTGLVHAELADEVIVTQNDEERLINIPETRTFSCTIDISNNKYLHRCSRKKYKKWLMACGWSRNEAEKSCNLSSKRHISYAEIMFLMKVLGWGIKK